MEVILKIKRNLKDVSTFLMKQDETSVQGYKYTYFFISMKKNQKETKVITVKVRMEGTVTEKAQLWVAGQVEFLALSGGYTDTHRLIIH